jgi:hypothetical protein
MLKNWGSRTQEQNKKQMGSLKQQQWSDQPLLFTRLIKLSISATEKTLKLQFLKNM